MVNTAIDVWRMFLDGKSKASISRKMCIQRNEVTAIIKFTTEEMYFPEDKLLENIQSLKEKNQKLNKKIHSTIKESNIIINKQNVTIKRLRQELSELKKTNLSIFGKKVF